MPPAAEAPKTHHRGVVVISGFRESEDASSGTERLHQMIRVAFHDAAEIYDLRPWDHDFEGLAAKLLRDRMEQVVVIGYSWGGGFGAPWLARECGKHGIRVPLMLLCDAVYRPPWLWRALPANVLALRAVLPGSARITIPGNVERVAGVYQTQTVPKGHAWKVSPGTVRGPHRKLASTHTEIDDHRGWRELVADELDRFFSRP